MLVGPNAPLVFDRKVRSTYVEDVFDFYKPKMDSEYALVDGHQSIICYHQAVDKCFKLYFNKASKNNDPITFDQFDAMLFHSPYCKLVQKTMARLFFLNYLKSKNNPDTVNEQLKKYKLVVALLFILCEHLCLFRSTGRSTQPTLTKTRSWRTLA